MKDFVLLLLFLGCCASCRTMQKSSDNGMIQSTDILLIATTHDLREIPPEAIEAVKNTILSFEPGSFFVELPPADDQYANEVVFGYSRNFELFHHLLNKKNIQIRMADSVIHQYQQLLSTEPDNPAYLGNLLHAYLLKFDISNALYYSYLLFSQYSENDSVMAMLDSTLFSADTLDQYQLIITGQEKDEFSQIIFPVAKKLGIRQLYGFDNRDDEYAYNKALKINDQELQTYVKDEFGITNEDSIKIKLEALLQTDKRRGYTPEEVFRFLNTEAYDAYRKAEYKQRIALTNSESSRNYLKFWQLRNQKMANNIAQVIQNTGTQRAVVLVGAAHAWALEQMLTEKGYNVVRPFRNNP